MRILQISKHYYPYSGGVESYTREVVLGLKQINGIALEILTANELPLTIKEIIDSVLVTRVASYGELFSVPLCPTFPFWLNKSRADIIHFQMPFPLAEFSEILFKKRSKIVVSWHSDIIKQEIQRKLYEPFLLRFLDRVDKILVATPNHISSSLYLPRYAEKCEIVPYGIDIDRFTSIDPNDQKIKAIRSGASGPIILFVGRLVYYKGIEYLISAMKEVKGTLIIIGDGPLKNELISLINSLELKDKVKIISSVKDEELPLYYHACDIFVLPSIANSEAFGIVQLEAMACGKPVITTDLPTGVTYVNQNGVTGLVVPKQDPLALANALNALLKDPEKMKRFGENGRIRVKKIYNNKDLADNIYKVYSGLL